MQFVQLVVFSLFLVVSDLVLASNPVICNTPSSSQACDHSVFTCLLLAQVTRTTPSKDELWKGVHAKLMSDLHIAELPTSNREFRGMFPLTDRVSELLRIIEAKHGDEAQQLVVEVTQCASRHAWGPIFKSMVKKSVFYAFGPDRRVLATEHYRVLGFPELSFEGLADTSVRELAGESFAPPCIGVVMLGLLSALRTDIFPVSSHV